MAHIGRHQKLMQNEWERKKLQSRGGTMNKLCSEMYLVHSGDGPVPSCALSNHHLGFLLHDAIVTLLKFTTPFPLWDSIACMSNSHNPVLYYILFFLEKLEQQKKWNFHASLHYNTKYKISFHSINKSLNQEINGKEETNLPCKIPSHLCT